MRVLKIQEAQLLLKKILSSPKNYDLKLNDGIITGSDDEISFRFYKESEKASFEVTIDGFTFVNNTGEWNNAMIMLENTIKKMEREQDDEKIEEALSKLKKYLSSEM